MKLILTLAVGLCLTACGKNIRPDDHYPAINSNYPSAEFQLSGKTWVGLGYIYLEPGQRYNDAQLKISGYYRGTMRVVSEACEIDATFRYEGTALVSIFLPGNAERSCLISFVVSPEYPGQDDQAVVIHALKGHAYIKVGSEAPWLGLSAKLRQGEERVLRVPYEGNSAALVIIRGCGVPFEKTLTPVNGFIEIPIVELGNLEIRSCIFQGSIESETSEARQFTFMVWFYDDQYQRLHVPAWSIDGSKIKITADKSVTVVGLDGEYELDYQAEFKFDRKKPHTVRLGTVAGRTMLGFWDVKSEAFQWTD